MRTFNTSGPNRPEKHHTIRRSEPIKKGILYPEVEKEQPKIVEDIEIII